MSWPLWQRIAFRFVVLYWMQYIFLTWWREPVVWSAKRFLGIHITVFPAGSGDTTFNYVQVLLLFAVSIIGTAVWSLIDRRKEYLAAHDWLRVLLRYWLAGVLLQYGMAKVFQSQFPFPSPERLVSTYGDSSPMGLLWTFMGYSRAYNHFTGWMEVLPALLLFARRTTTLGSLLAMGVMSNVVALNFCYDVPVKLYSMHLLLTAVILVAPDLRRTVEAFVLNRAVGPVQLEPPYRARWMRRLAAVMQIAVAVLLVTTTAFQSYSNQRGWNSMASTASLAGVYEVQEFTLNGRTFQYPDTHHLAWRNLAIGPYMARIVRMNGSSERLGIKVDPGQKRIELRGQNQSLSYRQPDEDHLEIDGALEGEAFRATLRRVPDRELLLVDRGFHWINEFPFNR